MWGGGGGGVFSSFKMSIDNYCLLPQSLNQRDLVLISPEFQLL